MRKETARGLAPNRLRTITNQQGTIKQDNNRQPNNKRFHTMHESDANKPGLGYKVVATKVSNEAATALEGIATKNNTTIYDLLQSVCSLFIKMMSAPTTMSSELAAAVRLFEGMMQYPDSFNLADATVRQMLVKSAIYFVGAQGKKGTEAVLVERPYMSNDAEVDWNIQHVIEAFLCNAAPSFYRRLRRLAVELECNSIYECLDKVIDLAGTDPNEAQILELFQDNDRHISGRKPASQPYRRKMHRDINNPNLFDD